MPWKGGGIAMDSDSERNRQKVVQAAQEEAGPQGADGGYSRWPLAVAAVIVAMFMVILDTSIVNIAIPAIDRAFRVGTAQVQWVVTIYLLAVGLSAPASGWLADRIGYKRLYLAGLAVFTTGSVLCAAAPSLPLLVAARVMQAIGGGTLPPVTTALLFRIVPREKLGAANGWRGIAVLVGPALGPTLGGYLVQYVDWRWIFLINLPVGIAGMIFGAAVIPEVVGRLQSRFDAWGFATATMGLGSLLLAFSLGNQAGWGSPAIVALFGAAGVLLLLFVGIELHVADPLIDLHVLGLTSFSASLVLSVVITGGMTVVVFFLPIFLQLVRGEGALQAGWVMMPWGVASALVMPLAGRIYDRIDAKVPTLVGMMLLALSTWLLSGVSLTTPDQTIALWTVVFGIGMGLAMMPAMTAGMSVVPRLGVGRAAAMSNVVRRASGSFGIALLTVVLDNAIVSAGASLHAVNSVAYHAAFVHGLQVVFTLLTVASLLGLVPALMLRGDRGQRSAGAREERA